jgi:hypothetical protein
MLDGVMLDGPLSWLRLTTGCVNLTETKWAANADKRPVRIETSWYDGPCRHSVPIEYDSVPVACVLARIPVISPT